MAIPKILWVDDEIESLRAHLTFLESKGYHLTTSTNGADAISSIGSTSFDCVLLDENMPGLGGLETLKEIKKLRPNLPVVMITKSEAENLMEEAIGKQIADFLIKPVNPNQILLSLKKILEKTRITTEITSRDYLQNLNALKMDIDFAQSVDEWLDVFTKLTRWELLLAELDDDNLTHIFSDQKSDANIGFVKFVEERYKQWVLQKPGERPTLSVDILDQFIAPALKNGIPTFYIVIDCLRADQWMMFEKYLADIYTINTKHYLSILPTATPYSRNALFSGLFPSEIENKFPEMWTHSIDSEESLNKYEPDLLKAWVKRKNFTLNQEPRYFKIINPNDAKQVESAVGNLLKNDLSAIVVNFVDMISHARSDMAILKELAPDEVAYRSISNSWFEHSFLLSFLKTLANHSVQIIITSDHGCIRCQKGTMVHADKETSTNLRYKYGRNINVDSKETILLRNPTDYRLPKLSGTTNYVIAKGNNYFLYPNNYNYYQNQYRDTFQHGGLSMEEMIVPISILTPKKIS